MSQSPPTAAGNMLRPLLLRASAQLAGEIASRSARLMRFGLVARDQADRDLVMDMQAIAESPAAIAVFDAWLEPYWQHAHLLRGRLLWEAFRAFNGGACSKDSYRVWYDVFVCNDERLDHEDCQDKED